MSSIAPYRVMPVDPLTPTYRAPPPEEELSAAAAATLAALTGTGAESDARALLLDARNHTLSVWRALFDRCLAFGPYHPKESAPLAQLALELAARLPESVYGLMVTKDCQALAASLLAEAQLRLQHSDQAEAAFEIAEAAASFGAQVPSVLGPLTMVQALLQRSRGEWGPAQELFSQAAELFSRIPEPDLQGAALIRRGRVLEQLRRPSEAYDALAQGLQLCRDPYYAGLQQEGVRALVRLLQGGG